MPPVVASHMCSQNFFNCNYFRMVTPIKNLFLTKYFHTEIKRMKKANYGTTYSSGWGKAIKQLFIWLSSSPKKLQGKHTLHTNEIFYTNSHCTQHPQQQQCKKELHTDTFTHFLKSTNFLVKKKPLLKPVNMQIRKPLPRPWWLALTSAC